MPWACRAETEFSVLPSSAPWDIQVREEPVCRRSLEHGECIEPNDVSPCDSTSAEMPAIVFVPSTRLHVRIRTASSPSQVQIGPPLPTCAMQARFPPSRTKRTVTCNTARCSVRMRATTQPCSSDQHWRCDLRPASHRVLLCAHSQRVHRPLLVRKLLRSAAVMYSTAD